MSGRRAAYRASPWTPRALRIRRTAPTPARGPALPIRKARLSPTANGGPAAGPGPRSGPRSASVPAASASPATAGRTDVRSDDQGEQQHTAEEGGDKRDRQHHAARLVAAAQGGILHEDRHAVRLFRLPVYRQAK